MNPLNYPPIIFGTVSLDGRAGLEISPDIGVKRLHSFNDVLQVYQLGESTDIHTWNDNEKWISLYGRTYEPLKVAPNDTDPEKINNIGKMEIAELAGAFILIKAAQTGAGIKLELSTDKYGFRRLLYFHDENALYFSTHLFGIKILLNGKLPGISKQSLLHYYNFGFTPNHISILEGVQKMPPASTLTVENGSISLNRYFSISSLYIPDQLAGLSEEAICRKVDESFKKAIEKRIPEYARSGVALSGGVDSGYIAQKLSQLGADVIGYNLSYKGSYDEYGRVDFLAEALGIKVKKIEVAADQIIENFINSSSICSEPVGFNNATMRFVALEAQKDDVGGLFDGDGADRIFLGMSRYLKLQKVIRLYGALEKMSLGSILGRVAAMIPNSEFLKLSIQLQNWGKGLLPYPERDMSGVQEYNSEYEQELYNLAVGKFREQFDKEIGQGDFGAYFTYQAVQMVPEMFFYDPAEIQGALNLFPVPGFWDDELVSLAFSLPTSMKLRQGKTKYILRAAASLNIDKKYWMLPKIGLQNSYAFVLESEEGRAWRNTQMEKVESSPEYKFLQGVIPSGRVVAEKLIPLLVWKEENGLS